MKRLAVLALASALLSACSEGTDSVEGAANGAAAQAQTPAERGLAVANANACTACHALNSTRGIGPGWGGLYGTTRSLKDGRTVVADEEYLRRAIREPAAEIVDGFDNVMVTAAVSDAQITDIIALIEELKSATTP